MEPSPSYMDQRLHNARHRRDGGCKLQGTTEKQETKEAQDAGWECIHCSIVIFSYVHILFVFCLYDETGIEFFYLPPTASLERLGIPNCTRSGKVITFLGVSHSYHMYIFVCCIYMYYVFVYRTRRYE